ncbi:MAG: ankyrin repeat domain-containing protein [Pseudomonadales bacterium]|jgi:ankyrin repeat protein|nr:ankyrin repeat domain-containing protein [Pseudomonadales bacterium]
MIRAMEHAAPVRLPRPVQRAAWFALALVLIGALSAAAIHAARGDREARARRQAMELLAASARGDHVVVEALLRRDVGPDVRSDCGWTPLMEAASNGHVETAAHLLAAGAAVDAADEGGYTALVLAAGNDHVDLVDLLLRHGADVDARERTEGHTALIWAAQRGHGATVDLLLRRGADLQLRDLEARTAADRARAGGHDDVLVLIEASRQG